MRGIVTGVLSRASLTVAMLAGSIGWISLVQPVAATDATAETSYPPISVDVEPIRVSEHVYYVRGLPGVATDYEGFVSNAGFVLTGDGVVVFDALGTPSLAFQLRQRIRELTDQPVVKVVVSHYHADHVYGLQVFKDEGAEIIAPAGAFEYIDSPTAQERLEERRFSLDPWVNDRTRVVAPDLVVEESASFKVGELTFRLDYQGKAHSDGDMSMYVVEDRVLFSGDIIFEGRIPFVGNADTRRWLEALRAMERDDVVAVIPGHGMAMQDPAGALRQTADYLSYLRQQLAVAVDELTPFADAYERIDWSRFRDLPAFEAANRRNAYQVYLSLEAEALSD